MSDDSAALREGKVRRVRASSSSSTPLVALGPCRLVGGATSARWGYLDPVEPREGEAAILLAPGDPDWPAQWSVGEPRAVLAHAERYLARNPGRWLAQRVEALRGLIGATAPLAAQEGER